MSCIVSCNFSKWNLSGVFFFVIRTVLDTGQFLVLALGMCKMHVLSGMKVSYVLSRKEEESCPAAKQEDKLETGIVLPNSSPSCTPPPFTGDQVSLTSSLWRVKYLLFESVTYLRKLMSVCRLYSSSSLAIALALAL